MAAASQVGLSQYDDYDDDEYDDDEDDDNDDEDDDYDDDDDDEKDGCCFLGWTVTRLGSPA